MKAQLVFPLLPLLLFYVVVSFGHGNRKVREEELDAPFWNQVGKEILEKNLRFRPIEKPAKNVVYFLGDGMGMATITAARIYDGQLKGMAGEDNVLAFETFPNVGLAKTYNVDKQVPDSAGTATAYLCGVKGNYHTAGVTARVKVDDCEASLKKENQLLSIMRWAQQAGKATGFITTMRVTHATPSGLYANIADREWESDSKLPDKHRGKCPDIATQLVNSATGQDAKVILGGGRKHFFTKEARAGGIRLEGDLVEQWLEQKKNGSSSKSSSGSGDGGNSRAKVVYNLDEFNEVDVNNIDFLLGLFNDDHMSYESDWSKPDSKPRDEPSLSQMVDKAIRILSKLGGDKGFFLFVEGGKIDWAHHASIAKLALSETAAFSAAVELAKNATDPQETLIVVTADHSHVMTINGYPDRGNDILGTVMSEKEDQIPDLNYTTLMYTNGPGYRHPPPNGSGIDITGEDTTTDEYHQLAAIPKQWESHGGEDVPVYSHGPMAHILRGVFEQNYLPHAIAYAACYRGDLCKQSSRSYDDLTGSSSSAPPTTTTTRQHHSASSSSPPSSSSITVFSAGVVFVASLLVTLKGFSCR